MDTIFTNSENSKTSDSHRLTILQSLILTIKINRKRSDKYVALSNLSYTWKNIQKSYKNNNLKHYLQHRIKNFNYLMDHILYQISKTILSISSKNMRQLLIIIQ